MPKSKYKKRADGRHLAQIPTSEYQENGRPKLKNIYARTQLELDSKIADFRKQVETGIIIEDKGITVAQYAEAFMTYKASREDSTRYMYSSALKKHILPYFGKMKMGDVRKRHIDAFLNVKAEEKLITKKELKINPDAGRAP